MSERKRRPAARPAEILAAALDLFSERGFAATRLEDVAARAGLSKAAIYLYFPDKSAVLRAIIDDAVGANLGPLERTVAEHQGRLAPLLRQFLAGLAEMLQTTRFPDLAKLIISESRARPEIGQAYLEHAIGRAFPLLRDLVARGVASGEFRAVDPAMTVRCIIGPMLLATLWRGVFEPIGGEKLDIAALAAQHADLLLRGLEPRP